MQIISSEFNIKHRNKFYAIVFQTQSIANNMTMCVVSAHDSSGKELLRESTGGRQITSAWNAKRYLTKALKEKGIIKPKKKNDGHNIEAY